MKHQLRDLLPSVDAGRLERARPTYLDAETLATAAGILEDVRTRGAAAVRSHAERLGDLDPGSPLLLGREEMDRALRSLPAEDRATLERLAGRIESFARAQRASLTDLDQALPGGEAGHRFVPIDVAGCYAPGGRLPLPSSVLMTAKTARVAGVRRVVVASPRPGAWTLAAAAIAGADCVLAVGGAQAIAALAFGIEGMESADLVCGPGNRFVTAAKKLVAGEVGIDMLAGPSELVVVADRTAEPGVVAADLLAQAEHDADARVTLITVSAPGLVERVRVALDLQVRELPSPTTAIASLRHGSAVALEDAEEAARLCDRLAPEHLQLSVEEPDFWRDRLRHYGALFSGRCGAEVFGDYGIGPNHVLPTGGAARHTGGLSVATFLRLRTWLHLDRVEPGTVRDTIALATVEGLHGHARAASLRLPEAD
jgi:histidinol dehydrogenase